MKVEREYSAKRDKSIHKYTMYMKTPMMCSPHCDTGETPASTNQGSL